MKASGLRGRGGAGFGTGQKWSFLPEGRVPAVPRGERRRGRAVHVQGPHAHRARPAPDRRGRRHLRVRDRGATTRSSTCAASSRSASSASSRRSPTRTRKGFIGKNILGSGFDLEVIVHRGAGAYIAGDETGLLSSPRGRARRCRASSRRSPRSQGLYAKPTVVNNVETLSTVPHILRMGGEEYAKLGVGRSTGTRIFSVSGHVERPGQLRGRARHHVPRPHRRPRRRHPRRQGDEVLHPRRRVAPVAACRRAPRRAARHGLRRRRARRRCSGRARSWCSTRRRTRCSSRGGSRSSSRTRSAASARRAARARAGSRRCCTASRTASAAPRTSTCCSTFGADIVARRLERAVHADDASARSGPSVDVAGREPRPLLPRGDPRDVQRRRRSPDDPGDERMTDVTPATADAVPMSQWPSAYEYVLPTGTGSTVTLTIDGREVQAQTGRAADQGRAGARRLHPALLLARAHEAGRHVPHVPRRGRRHARLPACVHDARRRRHGRAHAVRRGEDRPRTACSSSCSSTTRSTARSATAAASARCRTRRSRSVRASRASSRRSATGRSRSRSQRPRAARPRALHPVRPLHPLRRRDRRRPADRLRRPRRPDAGLTFAGRAVRRRTSPATRCRSARSARSPRRQYRFRARPWDLATVETSCTTCAVQCRGALQSSSNRLVRLLGVDREPVNHGWLCDKGRYGIRVGALRGPRRSSRMVRKRRRAASRCSWPEALDAAAAGLRGALDAARPGVDRRARRRARHERGRVRVGAASPRACIGTDNVDAQLGDGLPAEVVLGLPARDDRRLRPRRGDRAARARPQGRAPGPATCGCERAADELGVPLIELAPGRPRPHRATRRRDPVAAGRAGATRAQLVGARGEPADDGRRGRPRRSTVATATSSSCSAAVDLAESPAATVRPRPRSRGCPTSGSSSALRRGNVHGALDLGLAPGFLPGRVTLDAGREWFERRVGRGARRAAASTPPASSTPRPTARSRCSCSSAPTRSTTSPTATLAAARARRAPAS